MTTYPTLSLNDEMTAYAAIKQRYALKATQRDILDDLPNLGEILSNAHAGQWVKVAFALRAARIIP